MAPAHACAHMLSTPHERCTAGGPITIVELDPSTQGARTTQLGSSLSAGQRLQHVVPPHTWFGAAPAEGTAWALVGCTVAPGERRQVCRQAVGCEARAFCSGLC